MERSTDFKLTRGIEMIDSQVVEHQEIVRIESKNTSDLARWQKQLVEQEAQLQVAKAQLKTHQETIDSKKEKRLLLESNFKIDLIERAKKVILIDKEIELLVSQVKTIGHLIQNLNTDNECLKIDIQNLSNSLRNREKVKTIHDALEEFLPAQKAYLEAREKLFKIWYENDEALSLIFPKVPILGTLPVEYQSFNRFSP